MVLYLYSIVNMEHKGKKVLEWTEINGKKYPKRVVYYGSKPPSVDKNNGKLIDTVFGDGYVHLGRKRK